MQYLLYALIIVLVLGYPVLFVVHRMMQDDRRSAQGALTLRYFTAETAYLVVLRRELAHVLMAADMPAFGRAFYAALEWQIEALEATDGWKIEAFNALQARYPRVTDFDVIRGRHAVRYDTADPARLERIAETYVDLSRLMMLDRYFADHASGLRLYDEAEIAAFRREYALFQDDKFRSAVGEAMKRFGIYNRDRAAADLPSYEDDAFKVVSLTGNPNRQVTLDTEYGVALKKTREFAVYALSVDEENHRTVAIHRSNGSFSQDFELGDGAIVPATA
ncbi:MAG: hypothetical protein QM722_01105 [Piscinibacter sp.]